MPTYDYRCAACGHELEVFQSIRENALRKCPKCGKLKLERLIGPGAAILFKGGGFYQTDYRSESYKKAESAEKDGAKPASDSKSDSASKPASEPASKPGGKSAEQAPPETKVVKDGEERGAEGKASSAHARPAAKPPKGSKRKPG